MFPLLAVASLQQSDPLVLKYERSHFLETGSYRESVLFCRALADRSRNARVVTLGTSPEGRDIIALLISTEGAFTPKAAATSKKPLIFVNNGIHSGEIEGKDASLILARDMLLGHKHEELAKGANIIIVPIFSVDAHERFTVYNRVNQNGPKEMGWRTTAQNYNLNRDWVKGDAPEMRGMLQFLHSWRPDFLFDNHTTDGADYQYVAMLSMPMAQTLGGPLATWQREFFHLLERQVSQDGYLASPYFDMADRTDPTKMISVGDFSPRFSTGFWAALNRPSILVETHVLKPYRQRVDATYDTMVRAMEHCIADADHLKSMNREADEAERNSKPGDQVVLTAENTKDVVPYTFKGWVCKPRPSVAAGADVAAWDHVPTDYQTTLSDQYRPGLTVSIPAAYAIPAAWIDVIDRLQLHNLKVQRLTQPFSGMFDTYRFENVVFGREPFENHFMPSFKLVPIREARTLPPGSAVIRTNQVGMKLLVHMLEPEAPDSLLRWGYFNPIFEQKEYFEDYAMAPIADQMLASDAALKAKFEEKLKDPKFASNPRARLNFFYENSPYMDDRLDKYPVVRLDTEQLKALH